VDEACYLAHIRPAQHTHKQKATHWYTTNCRTVWYKGLLLWFVLFAGTWLSKTLRYRLSTQC
jgi:hypothetical protein